ncbi:hypothetical protein ACFQI7_16290 [Paenibacillus allorhizosphaerae]|uniref:hypothetical protein n=1 Tax=Paenibacillus allorhizosphaerae TaxID=2849866 RepID=UPI001C4073A7|nr:hypothetical protein [Paenibacillus allorhizosphaerae]
MKARTATISAKSALIAVMSLRASVNAAWAMSISPSAPRMAPPSAMPNSLLVSDMADADPALTGGAEPTIKSVARTPIDPITIAITTYPAISSANPDELAT